MKLENVDYELVPDDNPEWWKIRVLTGQFTETIIRFDKIEFDFPNKKKNEPITFNFNIIESPIDDLNEDTMAEEAGDILHSIIMGAVEKEIEENESRESLGTNRAN